MDTQKENRTTPVDVSYQLRLSDGSTTDLMMLKYSPLYSATLYLRGDEEVKDKFVVRHQELKNLENLIVLHPLPRVNEIEPAVDELSSAKYFNQVDGMACHRPA